MERQAEENGINVHCASECESSATIQTLEEIEADILLVMELAGETLVQLQKTPRCDKATLHMLGEKYIATVARVKTALDAHINLIQPYRPYGDSNYMLRQKVEILEALSRLSSEFEDLYQG